MNYTIEEFDELRAEHTFSSRYEHKKKKLLKQRAHGRTWILATAGSILAAGAAIAAISHTQFYQDAFGRKREDQPVREETAVIDKGYETEVVYEYPAHEYEEADPEKAEELIGGAVSEEMEPFTVRDHTFTILSSVRDANVLVMEYTIECPTGVTALTWGEHADDAHGATASEEATFWYGIEGTQHSKIYVDEEKSSDTKLYCVEYDLLGVTDPEELDAFIKDLEEGRMPESLPLHPPYAEGESPVMWFRTYDAEPDLPLAQALAEERITDESQITVTHFDIQNTESLPLTAFASDAGGYLELSPLGLKVDLFKGLDLGETYMDEIMNARITIRYADGTDYLVHDGTARIDNTLDLFVSYSWCQIAFNRLVDVDQVQSVEIGGVEYHLG